MVLAAPTVHEAVKAGSTTALYLYQDPLDRYSDLNPIISHCPGLNG